MKVEETGSCRLNFRGRLRSPSQAVPSRPELFKLVTDVYATTLNGLDFRGNLKS